ncbi:MAG: hypothetical protein N2445_02590 [Acidobacteria bacterium]|nr:hypothetical protein [Acidobacteriota bacterium]
MKRLFIFCSFLAVLFAPISSFCQAPTNYEQTRIHYLLKLDKGCALEYTTISKTEKETETTKTYEFVNLLDLKEKGMWIVKKYSVFNDKDDSAFITTTFVLLESGESLTIERSSYKNELKKESFKILTGNRDKSFSINANELKEETKLLDFIKENFSQNFCEKIEKFINLSVDASKEKFISFPISPFYFSLFSSKTTKRT